MLYTVEKKSNSATAILSLCWDVAPREHSIVGSLMVLVVSSTVVDLCICTVVVYPMTNGI